MTKNKQTKQLDRLLQKRIVQRFSAIAAALIVVGSVAFFGTYQGQDSHAASLGVLSMSPATGVAVIGSNVDVIISSDSGTDLVDAVQASVTYDATQLRYVSMSEGSAFPVVAATSTATPGLIRIGRATTASNAVRGNNTILTLTFKVLGGTGTTNLAFDPAFSFIVGSTDNVNILNASTGAVYTLKPPAPTSSRVAPSSAAVVVSASSTKASTRLNTIDPSVLIAHDGQNYSPADFNGDGIVGAADMAILLSRWHS